MFKVSELGKIDLFFLNSFTSAGSLYYVDITVKIIISALQTIPLKISNFC